jgi:putative toxin-antitoxin system antitoxin component (TIGR02293 family)
MVYRAVTSVSPFDLLATWQYDIRQMAESQIEPGTEKVVALLGGNRVFGSRLSDAQEMQEALRRGFPFAAFAELMRVLELRPQDLADLLGVASRTLARRKASKQLTAIESDRLYRVAYITLVASEVLGSIEKARSWLRSENRALGGHPPLLLLDTEVGERRVEDLLNRINYGIYG